MTFSDWSKSLAGRMVLLVIIAVVTFSIIAVVNGWQKPAIAWLLDIPNLIGAQNA